MASIDPFLGSSSRRDWASYSVKGNLLAARPRYIREKWGEQTLKDLVKQLDPRARAFFEAPILPFQWYPFEAVLEIDRVMLAGPMQSELDAMVQFGSDVARYDLSTLYKVLFKLGTPAFIVKRIGTAYGMYVKGGTMVPSGVESGKATVTLQEGSLPLYFCRYGIAGWFTAALELSGAHGVQVKETTCVHDGAARCAWQATWS